MKTEVYLLPKQIEVIRALEENHVEPYLESVKSSYNSPNARATLGVDNAKVSAVNGEFAGSSPFINTFLAQMDSKNPGILPSKTRHSERPDLEKAIAGDPDFLKGQYADFGIAIWPEPEDYEDNKLLYEILIKQFKDRNIPLEKGKLIYFSGLAKPVENDNSAYGLVHNLRDIDTKDLNIKDVDEFDWNFIRGKGMARAYRSFRNWSCSRRLLADSGSLGRVVGVGVEAPKNLTFGYSDKQLRTAFEKAGIPANYELVKQHLQEQ